jgi:hypothetical protein
MRRPELAAELVALAAEDRRVRAELAATGELFDGYHPQMRKVHRENGDRLALIIDDLGAWPGVAAVGAQGAGAAWMIAQHDIAAPHLMRSNLVRYRQAVARGDAEPAGLAYLEDRIRTFVGRPQRYGTQLGWDDQGIFGLWPEVEEPDGVDERRAEVGLGPVHHHIAQALQGLVSSQRIRPVEELLRDREQATAFARSVGWQ